jgi:hypothetical protein
MALIDPVSVHGLATTGPKAPGRLHHYLAGEPLVGHAARADAARRLPPAHDPATMPHTPWRRAAAGRIGHRIGLA